MEKINCIEIWCIIGFIFLGIGILFLLLQKPQLCILFSAISVGIGIRNLSSCLEKQKEKEED